MQLIEAFAEPIAETARYGEYLLQELKWDTSRNFSSTKHMARLVGKKLERKHSAVGSIIVSHSDVEGTPRYAFLGINNFNIDAESNYDTLVLDESLNESEYIYSLVPWTDPKSYTVTKYSTVMTKTGIPFICASTKKIENCTVNWDLVMTSADNLLSFKASDGWNNYKYLVVPVVQGIQKVVDLGISNGNAAQTFLLSTLDVEAADTLYTKDFCYIEITEPSGKTTVWNEIQHLSLASSTDRVFEIDILDDLSGTIIKFGDSIKGAIPSENSKITFHYLETLGKAGNVEDLYVFQNEVNLYKTSIPTNTKYTNLTIGCQNIWPITGGKDLETLNEYKENAETAYSKNYEILHTYTELENAINSISPIPLIKIKTATFYDTFLTNSTNVIVNRVGITGLSTALEPLNSVEKILFEKLINLNLNEHVLSNKYIKYLTPEIVKINSRLKIETKTPVLNKEDFSENLENRLLQLYGKSNINPIDCYKQADLLKGALQFNENIGSIQATSLLSINYSEVFFGNIFNSQDYYFLFSFKFPMLTVDTLGMSKNCSKTLADGIENICNFNISFAGNTNTFVVQETSAEAQEQFLFEQSEYFQDLNNIYLYKNQDNETVKYKILHLQKPQNTFSKKELRSVANLATSVSEPFATESDTKGIYFSYTPSSNSPIYYLAIAAQPVANMLGFKSTLTEKNIKNVYNALLGSLETKASNIAVSFEPTDKTVSGPWNTVMYYDNIVVNVENALNN